MVGRFLFRWRGSIGVLAFGLVFWLARPTFGSCLLGLPFLLAGLAVRFWASGYIGIEGRVREIGGKREEGGGRKEEVGGRSEERGRRREEMGRSKKLEARGERAEVRDRIVQNSESRNQRAELPKAGGGRREGRSKKLEARGESTEHEDNEAGTSEKSEAKSQEPKAKTAGRRIVSGPYRMLRHPLYIGNFLLVAGMLVALRPAGWLSAAVAAGFIAEYALIIVAEEKDLAEGRSEKLEARSESAEQADEEGAAGGKSEAKSHKPKAKTSDGGSRESMVQRPESFLLRRALVEWRTWAVTGVAWGLAVLKTFIAT